ncbi:MAG TPA: DUF3333 domain-containing protein, partial [Paracoccus sp.]|nr:DUF3333 domain-containing protein [Paracoccus sp. (in: a-proteobacteria)]
MSDPAQTVPRPRRSLLKTDPGTSRRNAAERRFRAYGAAAVLVAMAALAALMFTVFRDGASAFVQARATIPVVIQADVVDPQGNRDPDEMASILTMSYGPLLDQALTREIERRGIQVEGLTERDITGFLSAQARADLRRAVLADPSLVGQEIEWRMMTSSRVDGMFKGRVTRDTAARDAKTSVAQFDLAMALREQGVVRPGFNWRFITAPDGSDSRPESAGLGVAILGSLYMMLIVLVLALPIGVAASIWLEEFAPKNRLTDVIEVNISNLAA